MTQNKLSVCHRSGSGGIINISPSDLAAHEQHGDYIAVLVVSHKDDQPDDGAHFHKIGDALVGAGRATGNGVGSQRSILLPADPLPFFDASVPLIIANGHPHGSAGNGLVVEGFVLRSGHHVAIDAGGQAVFSTRVKGLIIRGNRSIPPLREVQRPSRPFRAGPIRFPLYFRNLAASSDPPVALPAL